MRIAPDSQRDPATGREVLRLTETTADAHAQYAFYVPFSRDSRYLVYPSNRTGAWQVWCLDLITFEHEQLTDARDIAPMSVATCAATGYTYYLADAYEPSGGRHLWRVSLDGEKPELNAEAQGDEAFRVSVPNAQGDRVAYIRKRRSGYALEALALDGRRTEVLHGSEAMLYHPSICPTDPDRVLVSRYGRYGALREQRMWLWSRESGAAKPIAPQPNWSQIGHETWMPDGREIVYFRYFRKNRQGEINVGRHWHDGIAPTGKHLTVGMGFYDLEEERETRWFPVNCWHPCPSLDGRWIVMDGSYPPQEISLCDPRTGETRVLCTARVNHLPNNNQLSHPHPSLSPDNRLVAFTSNREGRSAVYVVAT